MKIHIFDIFLYQDGDPYHSQNFIGYKLEQDPYSQFFMSNDHEFNTTLVEETIYEALKIRCYKLN